MEIVRKCLAFRIALHCLKAIVYPMLSQLYGVIFGFHLSCETNFIMEGEFSCVPADNHM